MRYAIPAEFYREWKARARILLDRRCGVLEEWGYLKKGISKNLRRDTGSKRKRCVVRWSAAVDAPAHQAETDGKEDMPEPSQFNALLLVLLVGGCAWAR